MSVSQKAQVSRSTNLCVTCPQRSEGSQIERLRGLCSLCRNPGYSHQHVIPDELGLVDEMLNTHHARLAIRDGRQIADHRVQEMREFIYGWAVYRDLIHTQLRSGLDCLDYVML